MNSTQSWLGSEARPDRNRQAVLIVDDHEPFAAGLSGSFRQVGFNVWLERSFATASAMASEIRPWLIVAELKIGANWVFDMIDSFRRLGSHLVVATAYPSVATAIRAVRGGAGGYMAKPVTADTILCALGEEGETPQAASNPTWPSLDRTIWEYINQVFVEAGSMSEAARRLRLDRRSLRRMLAKHPPAM